MINCDEWLKNPLVNPATGRKIKQDGPTFRKIQLECEPKRRQRTPVKKAAPNMSPKQRRSLSAQLLPEEQKKRIVDILYELARLEKVKGEKFRSIAYNKAAKTIRDHPGPITSGAQAKILPGVGVKIAAKIDEYLGTGFVSKLVEYRQDPRIQGYLDLLRVPGIGPAKAKQLVERGIHSVNQLQSSPDEVEKLSKQSKLGLMYLTELEQRIPRKEIDKYNKLLQRLASKFPTLRLTIAGSYRRGLETSGDIDILLTDTRWHTLDQPRPPAMLDFLDVLVQKGIIVDFINRGVRKVTCISQQSLKDLHRHMDIRFFPQNQLAFGLFYFTGPKHFNIEVRKLAIERGWKLSEYNLLDEKNVPIHASSEEEIMELLGLPNLNPSERENF
jgi:DNA polymerase beta